MTDEPDWYCREVIPGLSDVEVVAETEGALAFRPASRGFGAEHIIVVPKRHVRSLVEASPEELTEVLMLVQVVAAEVVDRVGGCQVLTTLGSEQHNRHLHWHVGAGDGVARFIAKPPG